jgi:nicotinate-nucleotide pyrophosphorylase
MPSSDKAAEAGVVETEEVNEVAEAVDVVADQVLLDRLEELSSRVVLWVLQSELKLWDLFALGRVFWAIYAL